MLKACFVTITGFVFLFAGQPTQAAKTANPPKAPPHVDLEATGSEYLLLRQNTRFAKATPAIEQIMQIGKRNLAWIKTINDSRPIDQRISISNKANARGIPIETPNIYNEKIVVQQWQELEAQLPAEMKKVLVDGNPAPQSPPLPDAEYAVWALKVDRTYQGAARWNMMQGYLSYLKYRRADDIRGFYFLKTDTNAQRDLSTWTQISKERQAQLSEWLIQECANSREKDRTQCASELKSKAPNDFHKIYQTKAQNHWDNYFKIQSTRSDVIWETQNPNVTNVTFKDPERGDIKDFLANIEDEWRWGTWGLKLNYTKDADIHLRFEAGSTPHVNGIAGNEITMDANAPLTEYDVQWTIRHEFGHVLGYPDCYIEFYDSGIEAIVNYQLDTTNLMCSRRGHLQETHFNELKSAYFH